MQFYLPDALLCLVYHAFKLFSGKIQRFPINSFPWFGIQEQLEVFQIHRNYNSNIFIKLGAIAFGLTLMIESNNLNVLLNIILLIIIFTTIFLGSLMQKFGKWIGLEPERSDFLDVHLNYETSIKTKSISDYGEIGYYNSNSLKTKLDVG